jgi:hypothetical protein
LACPQWSYRRRFVRSAARNHSEPNANGDRVADANANCNCNSYRDSDSDSNANGYSYGDCYNHPMYGEVFTDAEASAYSSAAPVAFIRFAQAETAR